MKKLWVLGYGLLLLATQATAVDLGVDARAGTEGYGHELSTGPWRRPESITASEAQQVWYHDEQSEAAAFLFSGTGR